MLRPPDEHSVVEGYPELIFTIQFLHKTLRHAEDHALKVGRTLSSIASVYGGYPVESCYLNRIASIGISGELISQHYYIYLPKPSMLSAFDQMVKHGLKRYIETTASVNDRTRYRVQSAIHWYGVAISADDPTVSYVAAWTGLECIGKAINDKFHPKGPKAHCPVCGNKAGDKRDRKVAGIDHIFHLVRKDSLPWSLSQEARERLIGELMDDFSSKKAGKLRNRVVHGLTEDIEALIQECSKFRRHLIYVLLASIQLALPGPLVRSWLPGDFGAHPDLRSSMRFNQGLRKSPYHGKWVEGFRYQAKPGVKEDGVVLGSEWEVDGSTSAHVESTSSEKFKRDVDIHSASAGSILTDLTTWHDRPSEPPWEPAEAQG